MTKPTTWILLTILALTSNSVWAQEASSDVQEGKRLATIICAACHVAASDQPSAPILRPPAPSFEIIAQRGSISADSLQNFLTTTHRDIGNPNGMPNPQLADYQTKEIITYLLSLRKQQ